MKQKSTQLMLKEPNLKSKTRKFILINKLLETLMKQMAELNTKIEVYTKESERKP